MTATRNRPVVSMNDTDLTLADSAEDVRGRTVVDVNGDDIGDVEDLMLDQDDAKVRFLQVGAGGFLGLGEKKFLIPVDAISGIDDDRVHVDRSREHITRGPDYDPTLVRDDSAGLWESTYTYYGYSPFWAPGYVYPAYPFYGAMPPGRPDVPADVDRGYGGNTLSEADIVHKNPDAGKRGKRDT